MTVVPIAQQPVAAQRLAVVAEAISWLGTPYVHNGRVKGRRGGVDCGQFIFSVFFNVGLTPAMPLKTYPPDFMLHSESNEYLQEVLTRAKEITEATVGLGDIVLYRIGRQFAHGGIVVPPGWPSIIHAFKPERGVFVSNGSRLRFSSRGSEPARRFFSIWGAK